MQRWVGCSLCASALGSIVAIAACSAGGEEAAEKATDAIIGGVDATSADWNAVGAMGRVNAAGASRSFCTGTLIAPNVVLTAKHCAMESASDPESPTHTETGTVYFLIGPNSRQPLRKIKATAVTPSSIFRGGFTGLGSDVALYTLSESITDIVPLKVAITPPKTTDEGLGFVAIGYGVQDAAGRSGTRKTGRVTLRAVSGPPAHIAFDAVDDYVASVDAITPGPMTEEQKTAAIAGYDRPLLLDYETFLGAATQDVQVCNGDSGGPLLREVNGKLVVFGVASTTMSKNGFLCSNGGVYAVFGASTRKVIARAVGETCWPQANGILTCGADTGPRACAITEQADGGQEADGGPTPFNACLGNQCCAEVTACLADPECSALDQCFDACPPASANDGGVADAGADADAGPSASTLCAQACYRQRPSVYGRYLGYANCARKACMPAVDADAGSP